jgi:hypothetical protein
LKARPTVLALATVSLAAGLSACGGGGSSNGTGTAPQGSFTTAPPTTAAAGQKAEGSSSVPGAAAARSGKASGRSAGSSTSGGGSTGGSKGSPPKEGAAGFVVPGGDNSIPNYGSESSSAERRQAAEALVAYLRARAHNDWSTACSYMGAPVRSQAEILAAAAGQKAKGCVTSLATLAEKAEGHEALPPFSGDFAAFRVKGDHAFGLFYGQGQQQYMMPMVSEGGAWNMGLIAPVAYPPGASGPSE